MLYKRSGTKNWYVKLKHRGRVIQRSTGTANKRDAEKIERELKSRLQSLRRKSGHTFNDAAIRWLDEKEHKRSLSTDVMILDWFRPLIGDYSLSDITRDRVELLRQAKLEDCTKSTVNRYMALLRSILKAARDDWEWIDKIPKVPMYPTTTREPRFLTFSQFILMVKQLPEHLAGPAWFGVSTGMRTQAIQSLQWDWISRDGVRFPPKVMKNGRWLTIPLSITAWNVLATQFSVSGKGATVFVNHVGCPWTEKFTTKAWHKAAKKAGLEGVTFHDLRHTWASWKLQAGVPEHVVMALGGWESREAFKIYARFSTSSLGKWVND